MSRIFTPEQADEILGTKRCEHCMAMHEVKKRSLNSTMVKQLAALYRYFKDPTQYGNLQFHMDDARGHWVHASRYLTYLRMERECLKLRYWGFIEEHPQEKEDGNPHSGYVRMLPAGFKFCEMKRNAYRYILTQNQGVGFLGFVSGDVVNITQAAVNDFDYGKEIGRWK